jgi:uncharacterized protein (TIRG00374 family)
MQWPLRTVKLVVFAAIVGLLIWFGGTQNILQSMRRVGFPTILLAFILSVVVIWLIAVKWRFILPRAGTVSLFKVALIGQFYSFFFLGQVSGEAAKIYLLSRASGDIGGSAVSVLADRLTSFIGLLILSVIGFALSTNTFPPALQRTSLIVLAVLLGGLLALRNNAVFALAERLIAWVEGLSPRLAATAGLLRKAVDQWHVSVANTYRVVAAVLMGVFIHVGNVLTVMILADAINIRFGFFDWCWIVGLMSIAGFIPITIGQVTAGGALVGLLQLLKVPLADAVALSALVLAVNFLLGLSGAVAAWRGLHRPLDKTAGSEAGRQ